MAETQRGGLAEKEIEQVLTLLLVIFIILLHQFSKGNVLFLFMKCGCSEICFSMLGSNYISIPAS